MHKTCKGVLPSPRGARPGLARDGRLPLQGRGRHRGRHDECQRPRIFVFRRRRLCARGNARLLQAVDSPAVANAGSAGCAEVNKNEWKGSPDCNNFGEFTN